MKLVRIDGDVQVIGRNRAVKLMLEKSQPHGARRPAIAIRIERVLEGLRKKLQARASRSN
jgi:hypothetical protein